MSNAKRKRSRFIELLIQQVIATCENEGNLFGGTTAEQDEVMKLIEQYNIKTGREENNIWCDDEKLDEE